MKKRLLIGKIIGLIGILSFTIGISYVLTYHLDKSKFQDINLLVTFEDTEEFSLENTNFLTYDDVIKTYPYIFEVKNNEKNSVKYEIKIKDKEISKIERNDLSYILFLNDKEIKKGNLSELNNSILYSNEIKGKKIDIYKLYIYLNKEISDVSYKYSLEIISNR